VHIGEESFKDGSLTLDEYFERMKKSSSFPTTSQVNPQDFHDVYSKYLAEGYKILSIHISSALSGTGQSAQIAKDMLETEDIVIIDTMNVSAGIMISVIEAGKMVKAGKNLKEIEAEVRSHKDRIKLACGIRYPREPCKRRQAFEGCGRSRRNTGDQADSHHQGRQT